jgi:hypothetical protein
MHEGATQVDVFLIHKGEDFLWPDIEFLADSIDGNFHHGSYWFCVKDMVTYVPKSFPGDMIIRVPGLILRKN